jgi:hypothetical protein
MKIIIFGSITAAEEILKVKGELKKAGHEVEIPEGVKNEFMRGRTEVSQEEKASDKIKYDLIKGYYEKIKEHDVVLVVNPEKRGVKGYIGGNTFLEMGFAYVLNKKIYCLHPLPDLTYVNEIMAMQPIIIDNDLNKIN